MLRNIYVLIILVSGFLTAADNKSASSAACEKDVHAKAAVVAPNPNWTTAGKFVLWLPWGKRNRIEGAPFLRVKDFESARQLLESAKPGDEIVLHAPNGVIGLSVEEMNSNAATIAYLADEVMTRAGKTAQTNDKELAAAAMRVKKELEKYIDSLKPQIKKEQEAYWKGQSHRAVYGTDEATFQKITRNSFEKK